MELPKIYKYLDKVYERLVSYLFVLPLSEFGYMLESVAKGNGIAREFHGFEIESDLIEFWYENGNDELSVEISISEFLDLITPIYNHIITNLPEQEQEFNLALQSLQLRIIKKR